MSTAVARQSARDLLADSIGENPYELIELLRDAGARKAKAEGVVYQMQEERKVVLAEVATEIEKSSDVKLSEAKLDRLARASKRYKEHLRGTAAAMEEKELAVSEYFGIKSLLEWDQNAVWHQQSLAKLER